MKIKNIKLPGKKRISLNIRNFLNVLNEHEKEQLKKPSRERDICPPETDAQLVVNCLCDLFLGENWCVSLPLGQKQVNTVILDEILYKYCSKYRKA